MPFIVKEKRSSWGKINNWDCIAVPIVEVSLLLGKNYTNTTIITRINMKETKLISSSLSPSSHGINLYFPKREIFMYGFLSIQFPILL